MLKHAYAIILAGGKGERFWPLSTAARPKQFLSIVGDLPLLARSVACLEGLIPLDRILVVTGADLVERTREAVPGLPAENIVGEPFGRDTGAACAVGAVQVKARDADGVCCVLTADHVIGDLPLFHATLREAAGIAASADVLLTIGIRPRFASTGFGYIEAGDPFPHDGRLEFYRAVRFVEKPDAATARRYLEAGNFYWNSGMFVWSAAALERALGQHRRPLAEMAARLLPAAGTDAFPAALEAEYKRLEKISIDYAVMEKADNIVMVQGRFPWDDVGSWPSLANHFPADEDGNVIVGSCEAVDSRGNVVVSKERLTALIGVKDVVVVQAGGATLVCAKDRAQDVKKMVRRLAEQEAYRGLL